VAETGDPHSLPFRLRWQAEWCDRLGSPLYGELLRRAAGDAESGGPVAAALAGHERDPLESMLQMRLMGAVHRLALSGRAPDLAAAYPSCGGDGNPERAWSAFRDTVADLRGEVREHLERPVQTNEVGRSRALACGFLWLASETGMPLRLFELGSSAGLNLRWDAFHYRSGALEFGDPGSPVQFTDFLASGSPPVPALLEVAGRAGCDPRPVDVHSEDGVLTLRSYVWADQLDRLELLDGAIAVAGRLPAEVERADTVEWLRRRLAGAEPGSARVVFHSIVMQYVEEAERERIGAAIADAGARATARSPLARLALEPGGEEAELRLTLWPGGEQRVLAHAGYHGASVRWTA
jgi:hypothetical protein